MADNLVKRFQFGIYGNECLVFFFQSQLDGIFFCDVIAYANLDKLSFSVVCEIAC